MTRTERILYTTAVVILTLVLLWVVALAVVAIASATVEGFESLMSWTRKEFG